MMQVISDGWQWAQISVPTGAKNIKAFAASLRRCGWRVACVPMGSQVTDFGLCKLTLIDVRTVDTVPIDREVIHGIAHRYGFIA